MLNINEELPLCAVISNLKTWQLTGLDTENSPVFNENFKNMVLIFIHWAGSNSKLTTPLYTYDFFVGVKRKGFQAAVSDQGLLMFDCALDIIRTRGSIMRDRSLNLTVLRQHGRTISTGPWEPSFKCFPQMKFPPFRWSGLQRTGEAILGTLPGMYKFDLPCSSPTSEGEITIPTVEYPCKSDQPFVLGPHI